MYSPIKKGAWEKPLPLSVSERILLKQAKKVLLIDFDPQGNMSSSVGIDKTAEGIYEVLSGKTKISSVIQKTEVENLCAVSANIKSNRSKCRAYKS